MPADGKVKVSDFAVLVLLPTTHLRLVALGVLSVKIIFEPGVKLQDDKPVLVEITGTGTVKTVIKVSFSITGHGVLEPDKVAFIFSCIAPGVENAAVMVSFRL